MKRLLCYIFVIVTIKMVSLGANVDSALVEHTTLGQLPRLESLRNPALHGLYYRTSFSALSLGLDLQRQSQAFVPEKGTCYTLPYLKVNTYHHLNEKSAVWGEASYTTGKQHAVRWNSTSDYDLLQPYVLADTVGGDTRRERYAIAGGYALRLNRWALGVEMRVRAEQEYRRRDPRMRGVVTDLTLRLGAGYELGRYRLAATFEGNIYRQTNSVAFYREESVIPEYQMTGLGTEYSRFSGDKRSLYHDGGGVAVMLHASPVDHNGFYADATLDTHRYHRKLAEYNSMPLTDLYNELASVTVGWERKGRYHIAAFGHFDYTRRTGNEQVGGASDARYFPVIARLTYPHRQLDSGHVYARLQGQGFLRTSSKLQLTLEANAAHSACVSDKFVMPFANMDASTSQLMRHKYDYAKANYTSVGAKVRADYALKTSRFGLFAELGSDVTFCSMSEHQTTLQTSIGITF